MRLFGPLLYTAPRNPSNTRLTSRDPRAKRFRLPSAGSSSPGLGGVSHREPAVGRRVRGRPAAARYSSSVIHAEGLRRRQHPGVSSSFSTSIFAISLRKPERRPRRRSTVPTSASSPRPPSPFFSRPVSCHLSSPRFPLCCLLRLPFHVVEVADQRARDGVQAETASGDVAESTPGFRESLDALGQRPKLGVDAFDHVLGPLGGGDAVLLPEHAVDARPELGKLARRSHQWDSTPGARDGVAKLWILRSAARDLCAPRGSCPGLITSLTTSCRCVSVAALVRADLFQMMSWLTAMSTSARRQTRCRPWRTRKTCTCISPCNSRLPRLLMCLFGGLRDPAHLLPGQRRLVRRYRMPRRERCVTRSFRVRVLHPRERLVGRSRTIVRSRLVWTLKILGTTGSTQRS